MALVIAFILPASTKTPLCSGNFPLKLGLKPGAYLVKEEFTTSTLEKELYCVNSSLEFGKFNARFSSLYCEMFILNGIKDKVMKKKLSLSSQQDIKAVASQEKHSLLLWEKHSFKEPMKERLLVKV